MNSQHGHLQRLVRTWDRSPVYFVTTCVAGRRALLANETVHAILRQEWQQSLQLHGWAVGRYVVMPDHVHFFIAPAPDPSRTLSMVVGKWKEWTAKRILGEIGGVAPLWQPEFFDHLLRSNESKREKWDYVRQNPVRAGSVAMADDWPYAGSIDFE